MCGGSFAISDLILQKNDQLLDIKAVENKII